MRVKAWSIPQTRLDRLYQSLSEELEPAALRALRSGNYILGPEVERFERNFSAEIGTQFALGVGNGLDALTLALRGLGIGDGDEVIVPANTYIATLLAITVNGATPVLVEPDSTFNINPAKIEPAITERTRAVLVVHLYGRVCAMEEISAICRRRSLELIEDCAQSQGAGLTFSKDAPLTKSGNFGVAGCFSFYPTKNLGAYGDAGAVTTGSPELADRIRSLRNYGSEKRYYNREIGANSRLDELQAALLSVK
jgi:dTDP-4-amino-4,6-dideoxygalactose transaminase